MEYLFKTKSHKVLGLIIVALILSSCFIASVAFGITKTGIQTAIEAFFHFDGSNEHHIIKNLRFPRAVVATLVGAALAVSGALMQALTRNQLASPDLFGVNAGAAFFVVFGSSFLSVRSLTQYTWISFLGAAVGALGVYLLGSLGKNGLTPIKVILSGAALTALFSSFTQGMLVVDERQLDEVLFWLTGSVAGRTLDMVIVILPYMFIGFFLVFFIPGPLNIFIMGEDVAKGLGQKTIVVKLGIALIIVLLSGSAVAVAGPIGFVGVAIPHIARYLVGLDYRWILPYCAALGGILLLIADISARFLFTPNELPVGVMTAFLGTPFFVYIARRGVNES